MNNKVVFAAAGSGKTYSICENARKLSSKAKKEILIISYTNEGKDSIEKEYRKQNYGVIDKNISITTWYSFVLADLIKPFQCLLNLKHKQYKKEHNFMIPENYTKSIAFYGEGKPERWFNQNHVQYFWNSSNDLYRDNVAALACKCIEDSKYMVMDRLQKIYSHIFIDELQDYAGWDLEIFKYLFASSIEICCVGDYRQATFRTNNSTKNKKYRDEQIKDFFLAPEQKKICSIEYSNETRRFNKKICDFVNTIYRDENHKISVNACRFNQPAKNEGVFIIDNQYMKYYCDYYKPMILRYDNRSKVKFEHDCNLINYGLSKGATFERVVIIPVGTVEPFIYEQEDIESRQTKAKFYVACTRAVHSMIFAVDNPKESKCFKKTKLQVGTIMIPAYEYIPRER